MSVVRREDVDAATYAQMNSYCGEPWEVRQVERELLDEWGGKEWSLLDFYAMVQFFLDKIPEDCWKSAKVEFDAGYDGGSHLRVFYVSPETDAEVQERVRGALAYVHECNVKDRLNYDRLREKFEPKTVVARK